MIKLKDFIKVIGEECCELEIQFTRDINDGVLDYRDSSIVHPQSLLCREILADYVVAYVSATEDIRLSIELQTESEYLQNTIDDIKDELEEINNEPEEDF